MEEQKISDKNEKAVEIRKRKKTLYMTNLSDETEEEDIQAIFTRVVPDAVLLDVRLIRDE